MKKNDVIINYGTDWKSMTKEICQAAELDKLIEDTTVKDTTVKDTAGILNSRKKIGLKPNLVNASAADKGATTHPEVVAGVIEYLKERGYHDISIIEGSWVGDRTSLAFRTCGYHELRDKYQVKLIDTQQDGFLEYDCEGVGIKICDSALSVDFMINIPVMKGHCQTTITCALKNNKGIIPNSEKRHFHTMGLHKPIAHLNVKAKNDFILVDGICGDLDFEEGGNPVWTNRILGFMDPVLCDAFVCSLLGYSVDDVPYIRIAENLGVGRSDVSGANVVELADGKKTKTDIRCLSGNSTRRVGQLAKKIEAKDACSACYGSLIHALDRLEKSHHKIDETLCIGQGYRGKTGKTGIGSCTSGFERCLKGCPPKAIDIVAFLNSK